MKKYIIQSITKFKNDFLAKGIYDILKWLFLALIILLLSKLFPRGTSMTDLFFKKYMISLYSILLYSLILVIVVVVVVNLIFIKKYRKIQKDNFTDELTGLQNHKALKKSLNNITSEYEKGKEAISIILLDIDDFKAFNTRFGYNIADQILKKVGELLGNDKRVTDATFRYFNRGDEFLIIAKDTSSHDGFLAAERKRKLIQNTSFEIEQNKYTLTVSCGVTEYKRGKDDFESLTNRVNSALHEAKAQINKNCTKIII